MNEILKVKKWGGENAAELIKSPKNIVDDFKKGIRQAVIVSAMRSSKYNTTDNLIELGKMLGEKKIDFDSIQAKVREIRDFHISIAENKGIINISKYIADRFDNFLMKITFNLSSHYGITPTINNDFLVKGIDKNFSVIGFGEVISSEIQSLIINNLDIDGLKSKPVELNGITDDIDDNSTKSEIFNILSVRIAEKTNNMINDGVVPIIPGYIPGFKRGIEASIGRGYSDATASMTAVGLGKKFDVTLEIQKSVLGILSADPRIVEGGKTKLIDKIDYLTAKEITGVRGAQAKLLHSQVLRKELQESGINVHLFNPFENTKGTIISKNKSNESSGIEYIGGRDNIIVFSVSSGNMDSKGILSKISLIANEYASIDVVSTSETEISFTLEGNITKDKLDELSSRIRVSLGIKENGYENFVKYDKNKALVFCIGQNLSHNLGSLGKAASVLSKGGINIEMVSQGRMERAIVFGIKSNQLHNAINLLHNEFIS